MGTTAIKQRKLVSGTVVSNKMNKTIVVRVDRRFIHSAFKKIVSQSKKYKAHDEQNECAVGDVVEICECRPLSKDKRWRLVNIVEKAQMVDLKDKQ